MAGLYVHIPFCKQACHYCDFHFSTNQQFRRELITAIGKELLIQENYLGSDKLGTVYFGGGTPSLLKSEELEILFDAISSGFDVDDNAEITLEANPDDLSMEKLASFASHGINRLSIGIQSFDDDVLRSLNRAHDSVNASQSVINARAAGFMNISIDLMYGLPDQALDAWRKNIERALQLSPQHISAYSLTIEDRTAFGKWVRNGKLKTPDEEHTAAQFEMLMDMLAAAGYEQYEISNFCLPGFYSRHNSGYWKQESYLGVGPGAHSFDHASRQWNVSNNFMYTKSLTSGTIPFEREILQTENKINEYIFTTLRTYWGCDLARIKKEYQWDLMQENGDYIRTLLEKELAMMEGSILKLTRSGKLVADKIASDLFADAITDR